jgi:hypothetical protein
MLIIGNDKIVVRASGIAVGVNLSSILCPNRRMAR